MQAILTQAAILVTVSDRQILFQKRLRCHRTCQPPDQIEC
jgi:hypothetical protein